ncbi:YjzC family protein [Paenibacillus sp. y28]|uniref:YjzC family protein n=1 Tax=Paenibacillus sp. y28 TaxID=3129110 RepID=UPI003019660D
MGEPTQFKPGDKAPKSAEYIEKGDSDHHMGINDPKHVTLEQGDIFPETTNKNRQWTYKNRI